MKTNLDIEAIVARKKEIEKAIADLQAEAHELDVALNVFRRFSPEANMAGSNETKLGAARPEGIPTIFEMAYAVIREAELQGLKGLSSREIVEAIEKQFWPGLQSQQVTPSLYNFAKKGRLRKSRSGLFQTVRTNEALTDNSESASENAGGVLVPPPPETN